MRIAIPVTNGTIAPHLGLCERFLVADVEDGAVKKETEHPNPGHGPGGPPPAFVASLGVEQVIAWGLPPHGRTMLEERGVKVLLGASGDPRKALHDFLAGKLELSPEHDPGGCGCH
ncbi:MAG: NifB/NifX family molybdenum-iron cluster-binding protein [Polyangiaceae bacterium]|nr:NifB/NifX family molybdenum-iron cluster-binding protein [Polyangiaceae bacterium]